MAINIAYIYYNDERHIDKICGSVAVVAVVFQKTPSVGADEVRQMRARGERGSERASGVLAR